MSTANAQDVISSALKAIPVDGQPWSRDQMAQAVMSALSRAGVVVINPQDVAWGECPSNTEGNDGEQGPHEISTSLCVWCLEYDPE